MPFRLASAVAGIAMLVLALGFYERAEWATELWPWTDSSLSFIFLASILAAIALPVLWIAATGEQAAVQAGAADLAITFAATTVYLIALAGDPGQPDLTPFIVAFAAAFALTVAMLVWSRRLPWQDDRPIPGPVRGSFVVLAAVLIPVGIALAFGVDIFPWELRATSSAIYGFIFLGAAAYFLYGLARPRWSNAAGQLIGFLAYDIVLIGPFLDRFGDVSGRELLSLSVYTIVLLYSGAVAVYYLLVSEDTRFGSGLATGR